MSRAGRCAAALLSFAALAGCGDEAPVAPAGSPRLAAEVRPDTPGNGLLFRFDPGEVVETFGVPAGRFLVHFTREGDNAVPSADSDGSGVPDFVEQAAATYEYVLGFYEGELGFRAPVSDESIADNGGDGRFDVYLVDFAGVGDGNYADDVCGPSNPDVCAGYMVQENDFAGYGYPSTTIANRILASHELFHAVQAAYDGGQGSVMAEGSAVWATERFDPTLNDFEAFAGGYLDNPDRSIDVPLPGPVDPYSYGAGVFFQFLDERFGPALVRALWERSENGAGNVADPYWLEVIDGVLADEAGSSFPEAFVEHATWNLFTGSLADPARSYANGASYPKVSMEAVTAPYVDDALRVFYASAQYYRAPPDGRAEMTAALVAPPGDPGAADDLALLFAVQRGSDYDPVIEVAEPAAAAELANTSGADTFVAIVVNTRRSGESKKPAFCLGSADEVAACRAAVAGDSGSGGGGAGAQGGGGAAPSPSEPGEAEAETEEGGCGCRVGSSGRAPSSRALLLAGLAAVALFGGRRRRRPT